MNTFVGRLAVGVVLATAPAVHAQTPDDSAAATASPTSIAAEGLFRDGLQLMRDGKLEEACPKLAKSLELDAAIGTKYRLAECYEQLGRHASAWQLFVEVADEAARSADPEREKFARDRAAAIRPQVSTLTIQVPSPVPAGLMVKRGGVTVAQSLWGTPIPTDPGEHQIEVSAPATRSWRTTVRVEAGGKAVVVVAPDLVPADAPRASGSSPVLPAGIVVGTVGLLALGAGVAVGFVAKDLYDSAPGCDEAGRCATQQGFDDRAQAITLGNVGTGLFVGGAVLAAAGVVMFTVAVVTNESAADGETEVVVSPSGLGFRARF